VNVIVCIKQVPDTETQIKVAPDAKSIVQDDIKWVMNPYDEFGVEEALRLKEKFGGEVTVVGLGPKRVTESLRTALAMGADKAVLVNDPLVEGSDSLAVAKALAAVIKDLDYDLIFTGQRGVDDDWTSPIFHLSSRLRPLRMGSPSRSTGRWKDRHWLLSPVYQS
jgi:electron transfer flavoprotein beta subunit